MKPIACPIMKQNADIQEGISQALSAAKPLPIPKSLNTNKSFQMRYNMRIFHKGHQNDQRSKF